MKNKVVITIDVEAQPPRATANHINRLVYGSFDGRSFGIGKMFDIADNYNIKCTAFIDYCGISAHGDKMLEVASYTRVRGHDPQLHMHPEYLAPEIWSEITPQWNGLECDEEQAEFLAQFLIEQHARAGCRQAVAFRGGGFRYNENLLKALARRGIRYDFSYNPAVANQPFNQGIVGPFQWEGISISEIPVSCVENFNNLAGFLPFNFNHAFFIKQPIEAAIINFRKYLEMYFHNCPGGIATLVMHSWSFLNHDANKQYFESINDYAAELFAEYCAILARDYETVSASQLAGMEYAPEEARKWQLAKTNAQSVSLYSCPVCGAGESELADHAGIKRRRCKACGSLERQRTLAILCSGAYLAENLHNRKFLHLAAQPNERTILAAIPGVQTMTLDIRPDLKPDIVADLTNLHTIPDASFDAVLASEVFSHVEKLSAALAELHRVLKPDGIMLQWDFTMLDKPTRDYMDLAEITRYYGMEAYQKYRVGRFRHFGELDIESRFAPFFERTPYRIPDKATGTVQTWNCWRKLAINLPLQDSDLSRAKGGRVLPTCPTIEQSSANGNCETIVFIDDTENDVINQSCPTSSGERSFFISSDNVADYVEDGLYGFALATGKFITNASVRGNVTSLKNADFGCYSLVETKQSEVHISVDASGFGTLYLYQDADFWASSNSFARLIDELRSTGRKLTLDYGFAAQMFEGCATPLTAGATLCNKIRLIPSSTIVRLDRRTGALALQERASLPLISAAVPEGIAVIDQWITKWTGIIRSLAETGLPVIQDITGGRDSRIIMALTLAAGIKPDKFAFQCMGSVQSEDYKIASAICSLHNLPLNAIPYETYRADYEHTYGIFRDCKKYLHTLGSNEPIQAQPVVRLTGAAGELRRGAWRMPQRQYASWLTRRYGDGLRGQAVTSLLTAAGETDSMAASRNFAACEPVMQLLYSYSRMRWHFGCEAMACYYRNQFILAPLADPLLDQLHMEGLASNDFIFAFILARLGFGLANLPFDGNHDFSPEVLQQAHNINRALGAPKAGDAVSISGFSNLYPFTYPPKPAGECSLREIQKEKLAMAAATFNRHYPEAIIADEWANRLQHGPKLEYILAVSEFLE